jgi:uncharacterized SAM-dependent methyltransferase
MRIDTLLTERMLAEAFAAALHARRLDEKFFYWFPLSVRAWLALCSDGAYRNYVRSRSLVARSAQELAGLLGPGPVEVLSLGAGQGDKDVLLLQALRSAGDISYLPVDASQALLEIAVAAGTATAVPTRGVKADITQPEHLSALQPEPGSARRLVLLLGNTLGAFDPVEQAKAIRAVLRPGDLLLADGEVYAGAQTLAGYDNPLNRRFAWAPLAAVGLREADGDLVFVDREDARRPGCYALAKHFEAGRVCEALVGGEPLPLARGDRVFMNHSYKYTPRAFLRVLSEAGLRPQWQATSEDGRFLMVLAAPE